MATVYKVELTSHWISYSEDEIKKLIEDRLEIGNGNVITVSSVKKDHVKRVHRNIKFGHYAWLPTKTEDEGWVWFRRVIRVTDERPEIYIGLLPSITYWCKHENMYLD